MRLYLVHHGEALDPATDPQRPLSVTGLAHVERVAEEARGRGMKPEVLWHSGKLRAKQTAQVFWRICNPLAGLRAVRGLQPGDPPAWICDRFVGEEADVAIVGHLPHLARVLEALLGPADRGDNVDDTGSPSFPPHGVVALERVASGWLLSWSLDGSRSAP